MADLRRQTCCFTGHRAIPPHVRRVLQAKAEGVIKELYSQGIIYYGCGGALGFDTMMAKTSFKLRDSVCPRMRVILVYPFDGYTERWNLLQQAAHNQMLKKFDKIVRVSKVDGREAYLERNRHLVNNSSVCVAYCVEQSGGTAYTVRYARERGLRIINLAN